VHQVNEPWHVVVIDRVVVSTREGARHGISPAQIDTPAHRHRRSRRHHFLSRRNRRDYRHHPNLNQQTRKYSRGAGRAAGEPCRRTVGNSTGTIDRG
jgi:hypothetical protein